MPSPRSTGERGRSAEYRGEGKQGYTHRRWRGMSVPVDMLESFVAAARRCAAYGLMRCSSGNLSCRLDGQRMLVKASRAWMSDLTTNDVAVCRIGDGAPLNGKTPSVEIGFHSGILRGRPDVNVVLHFQTPAATTLVSTPPGRGDPLRSSRPHSPWRLWRRRLPEWPTRRQHVVNLRRCRHQATFGRIQCGAGARGSHAAVGAGGNEGGGLALNHDRGGWRNTVAKAPTAAIPRLSISNRRGEAFAVSRLDVPGTPMRMLRPYFP